MEKRKLLEAFVLVATAVTAGILIKKRYEESVEEYDSTLAEKKEHFQEIGLSEEQAEEVAEEEMREEPVVAPKESTTIRAFRLATNGGPFDVFAHTDISEAGATKPVIHVKAEYTNVGYERISLIYQLPNYLKAGSKDPRLGDYKRAIDGTWKGETCIEEGEVQLLKNMGYKATDRAKLVGYAILRFKNPDYDPENPKSPEYIGDIVEIPEDVYDDYSFVDDNDKKHDGLTKFYEAYLKDSDAEEEFRLRFADYFTEDEDEIAAFELEGIFLAFKVTYEDLKFEDVAAIVYHSVNKLEVTRQNVTGNAVMFDHVLYHAPATPGAAVNANMSLVYTYKEGTSKVIVKDLLED